MLFGSEATILQPGVAKVDQQAYGNTGRVQIIEYLCVMLIRKLRNRFQFDDYSLVDQQIGIE